ncbi:unnamed protein product [Ixodes persulcatus]
MPNLSSTFFFRSSVTLSPALSLRNTAAGTACQMLRRTWHLCPQQTVTHKQLGVVHTIATAFDQVPTSWLS